MFDNASKNIPAGIPASQYHQKTLRFNNYNKADEIMTNFVQGLGPHARVYSESTSVAYVPLRDLPQDLNTNTKQNCAQQTKNYFKVNSALQPFQFVCTVTYTTGE